MTLYPVLCFRHLHVFHNTPWAVTICKEISVKNSDNWYWTWKHLRKEKCVRVVPFTKHQITCGLGLKQITLHLKRKPGIGQTRLQWNKKFRSFRLKARKIEYLERYYLFLAENFHRDDPFHLNSPRNYRVLHTNGKRSLIAQPWAFEKCPTKKNNALRKG